VKGTHKVVKGEFAPLVFETWKVFLGEDFWARHFGILFGSGQSYLFSLFVMRKQTQSQETLKTTNLLCNCDMCIYYRQLFFCDWWNYWKGPPTP
jgi:hypothetical protein